MTRNHTSSVPRLTLNTGVELPALGYGVFQTPPEQTVIHEWTQTTTGSRRQG